MGENYSQLELAPNERTDQSPELQELHDRAANAPELDRTHESPELDKDKKQWPPPLSPSTENGGLTPSRPSFKTNHSHDAPESDAPMSPRTWKSENETMKETYIPKDQVREGGTTEGEKPVANEEHPQRRRRAVFWILTALIVLLVLAIALGVGLGVGLTRNKGSDPSTAASSTATSTASLPHGISNDSSVSVVALDNGDKRLWWQEHTGNIREALYTAATKQWTSNVNNIVATNAKNSTPLAALLVNSSGTPFAADTGPVIFLFYIAQNNVLASKQFISGSWTTRDNFSPTGSSNVTIDTAVDTRALAVTSIANSTVSGEAYVFYVAQNGSAVALSILPDNAGAGIVASPGPTLPESLQGGHILALAAGITGSRPQVGVLTSNGTVYYNLYFSFLGNNTWTDPELQTILVPPLPPSDQVIYPTSLTLANAYPASSTATALIPTPTSTAAAYNETLIGDVNIAQVFVNNQNSDSYTLFGFWVNGTDLAAYTTKNIGLSTQPQSPFPYRRLAGTTVGNGSDIYLYHQVNQASIAEDKYNLDGGFFTTTYFEVSTS